jgi:hypothetical protein
MKKYVLMRLQQWDRVIAMTPMPQRLARMENSVGFLLVYDSLDELRKHWPDAEYSMIEPIEPKEAKP